MKRLFLVSLLVLMGVHALLAQQSDRSIITGVDEFTSHQSFSSLFEAYAKLPCASSDYTVVRFSKLGEPEQVTASQDTFGNQLKGLIEKAEIGDIYHVMNFKPLSCTHRKDQAQAPDKLVIYVR